MLEYHMSMSGFEHRITNLDNGIGDPGGWDDRVGSHHPVRVLFADLRDQRGPHSGTGTTAKGVGDLEP